jgi:hypothetical protein
MLVKKEAELRRTDLVFSMTYREFKINELVSVTYAEDNACL